MTMAMELIRHIAGLYGGKAIKGDITQVYITGNEIWMAQQVLAEQAEGAQEWEALPHWPPCNPACDPELNGFRDRKCSCAQARSALAQPSPARCQCCGYLVTDSEHRGCLRSAYPVVVTKNDDGQIVAVTRQDAEGSVLSVIAEAQSSPKCATCNDNGRIGGPSFYAPDEGGDPCPDCAQPSPALELERQEVVAFLMKPSGEWMPYVGLSRDSHCSHSELLMTVAQHERIVGALREKIDGAESQAEYQTRRAEHFAKERDAVLSRLAELEKQAPVTAVSEETFSANGTSDIITRNLPIGTPLYTAPVAQAGQVPEGYMLITQDQVERHATTAWECPPQSRVVLVRTLKRLHEKNSAVRRPAKGE